MIDTNQEEEKDPVRKILQSLHKVEASGDFEHRLERRIAEELSGKIRPGRFPSYQFTSAYAFSALALVATAAIAYSLFRFAFVSREEIPQAEGNTRLSAAPESLQRTEPTGSVSAPVSSTPSRADGQGAQPVLARPSPPDELGRRGVLREVGGGPTRSVSSGDARPAPFLQSLSDSHRGTWKDSMAHADSSKTDSLRRLPTKNEQAR